MGERLFQLDPMVLSGDRRLAAGLAARALRLALEPTAPHGSEAEEMAIRTLAACAHHRRRPLCLAARLVQPCGTARAAAPDRAADLLTAALCRCSPR